ADRDATATGAAQHAALIDVECDEIDVAATRDAVVELGTQPFEVAHLPEEGGHDDHRWLRRERAERAEQHLVEPRRRLALLRDLVDDLEHRHRLCEPVEVLADGAEVVDRLDLADDVELAALVEKESDV